MYQRKQSKLPEVSAELILDYLTIRQHMRPHAPLGEVIEQTTDVFGCCPLAIARAMEWLTVNPAGAIGRLRRSELVQLARAVHRFWMQAVAK